MPQASSAVQPTSSSSSTCAFDDRIATLRCRDEKDFRRVRSSIEQLAEDIKVGNIDVITTEGIRLKMHA